MPPHEFESRLRLAWPEPHWQEVTVIIGVSGGADSVALLRGMLAIDPQASQRLVVAHFNHGLRGAESDAEQDFVVELCRRLAVRGEVGRGGVDRAAAQTNRSSEAEARKARYAFFEQTAAKVSARLIATAHTADDQVETILHRVVRGTGLAGLAGIPKVRALSPTVSLVRPLLGIRRRVIRDYLATIGQDFRDDSSNRDASFTRNRIRHELLPELRQSYNRRVDDALLRLGALAGETQQVIDELVTDLASRAVRRVAANQIELDCRVLVEQPSLLVRELAIAIWKQCDWPLQAMTFDHWRDLAEMVGTDHAEHRISFPGRVCATKTGDQLMLSRP